MERDPILLAHQAELEKLFNKNQLLPRIRREFEECKEPDLTKYMESHKIDVDFGMDLLTQMALHKRCTVATLVGILRPHFDNAQKTMDMIQLCAEADLIDWDSRTEQFIVCLTISNDVQDELDRFQYPLPMVVEPQTLTKNTDNGYLLSKGSVILRKNHHNDDVCLDHINRVNRIKFCINDRTANMVKNSWRNLDKPKEGESKQDFEKRKRAFDKYDRSTHDVMAKLLEHGNEFYLTHKYDKRGRIYCQGYHVNYQGAPWNKAVIELADKELIND